MAFIVPVIRRDFPLYTQRQPPHSLVLPKRRCESMPINFHDDHLPMTASFKLEKEKHHSTPSSPSPTSTPSAKSPSIGLSNLRPKTDQMDVGQPNSSKTLGTKGAKEWLFPNQRVSISRLDDQNELLESPSSIGKNGGKRRVHFGIAERVEYDREQEAGREEEEEERENIEPKRGPKGIRRRASIPAQRAVEEEEEKQPKDGTIPMATRNNNNKQRTQSSPSILALTTVEGKEPDGAAVDLMSTKGKYNAVLFRLMSSLCTSKM